MKGQTFFPKQPKPNREEIARMARDLSLSAMALRSVMDELDKMQGRGEARIREDARRAVRHLADYLTATAGRTPPGTSTESWRPRAGTGDTWPTS